MDLSIPASSSASTMSGRQKKAAECRAVARSALVKFTSAPASIRSLAMAVRPNVAAVISGLEPPNGSATFRSEPAWMCWRTASVSPEMTAVCRSTSGALMPTSPLPASGFTSVVRVELSPQPASSGTISVSAARSLVGRVMRIALLGVDCRVSKKVAFARLDDVGRRQAREHDQQLGADDHEGSLVPDRLWRVHVRVDARHTGQPVHENRHPDVGGGDQHDHTDQ